MTEILHPYLREASRRAALIGAPPEYNPAHYRPRFSSRLGPVEIENPLRPLAPAWHDWAAGFLISLAIACLLVWTV